MDRCTSLKYLFPLVKENPVVFADRAIKRACVCVSVPLLLR